VFKGGLNARLNALGVAPPKMEKGPKSAPKFFSDSFQFLAELRVLQPPLCIKKPLCEAVLRVLAGSCTQNSTPFHIFSFFMKTHILCVGGRTRGACPDKKAAEAGTRGPPPRQTKPKHANAGVQRAQPALRPEKERQKTGPKRPAAAGGV
jgi:hypothetical protein